MGFEACCLLFAAAPVEDDEATLVWTPAAAFSSRKGQKAKKKSKQDASSDANATANPTKDILGAFEGRDDTTFIGDEEVTLHSYLSSMDDADGIDKEEPDERDGTGADACSNSSGCTSGQSSRNNDEETKKEQKTDGASSSSLSAATSSAPASVPDVSASAKAAVKEAQRAAAEFERKKRERAIAAEFERRRAERAAEREKQALEREARQAEARVALLERQRKEKEEADKKRRLASRAAFEERMKEAEELKRKREDAKRRRDQPQQYQRHHHHPSSAQSKPGFGGVPNAGQQQYQHVHQQQMHQSHYTQQEQYTSDPQPQPQLQPQTQAWPPSQPQSTSYPTNSAQFRARAAPTSPQTDQQRPYPQKIPSPSTFETSRTPAKMQATATPGAAKSTEEVKRSILITWALEPPNYQQLKPIATMIANLQVVLPPSFGVKSHEYFSKWKPIRYHDICQNEDALKKAVRKCRFFLHPDKLPSNLDELQTFVCKMIWDVMNDAWENHKTGVPV